jgi:hypothetical protein
MSVSREELVDALTCSISGKLFLDPVTSPCGHTFSRGCLARWMIQPGQAPSCPTCRAPLYHESPHQWPLNTVLVDLAERFLCHELAEARASEPPTDTPAFGGREAGSEHGVGDPVGATAGAHVHGTGGELPLFVLDSMTPGQELTLNVFEERYKLMVRRCLQATRRFGMVGLVDARRTGGSNRTNEANNGSVVGHHGHRSGSGLLGLIADLVGVPGLVRGGVQSSPEQRGIGGAGVHDARGAGGPGDGGGARDAPQWQWQRNPTLHAPSQPCTIDHYPETRIPKNDYCTVRQTGNISP